MKAILASNGPVPSPPSFQVTHCLQQESPARLALALSLSPREFCFRAAAGLQGRGLFSCRCRSQALISQTHCFSLTLLLFFPQFHYSYSQLYFHLPLTITLPYTINNCTSTYHQNSLSHSLQNPQVKQYSSAISTITQYLVSWLEYSVIKAGPVTSFMFLVSYSVFPLVHQRCPSSEPRYNPEWSFSVFLLTNFCTITVVYPSRS